jgi:EAL domain-containing protein (putative c-di-GMP-specific phosphodiesterase class I)
LRFERDAELRQALANNEFILHYQPQVDTDTEKLMGVEALIRWQHPTQGLLLPMDFIYIAEETGLIVPIGEWVIKTACQQNKEWQSKGLPPIQIAINVATAQLKQTNFATTVKSILEETDLDSQYLEIELTENVIILNNSTITNNIQALKELGVKITLDDFGTGNNSLNYFKTIPIDTLKIDKSFVQNINRERNDLIIVNSIIAMANSMNLEIIAEGSETSEQINYLKKEDCHIIQGFYFSKPLPSEKIESILKNNKRLIREKQ